MHEKYQPARATIYRQPGDTRWELAKPLAMPWHARLSIWWHRKAKPWLKGQF